MIVLVIIFGFFAICYFSIPRGVKQDDLFYKHLEKKVIENGQEYTIKTDVNKVIHWYNSKGQLHRLGDLPAVEFPNGSKCYFKHGKHHRLHGPAVVNIVDDDGTYIGFGSEDYYLFGKKYSKEEHSEIINNPKKYMALKKISESNN